jgi:hypothetical protein
MIALGAIGGALATYLYYTSIQKAAAPTGGSLVVTTPPTPTSSGTTGTTG